MNKTTKALLSVLSAFAYRGVTTLASIITLPIVLSYISKEEYGIAVAISSFLAFSGLLDFGIAYATKRRLAEQYALKNYDEMNKTLSTALVFYMVLSLLLILIGIVASFYISQIIKLPNPFLKKTTQIIFLISTATVTVQFFSGLFSLMLTAFNEIYTLNIISGLSSIMYVIFVWLALRMNGGLIGYVLSMALIAILTALVYFGYIRYRYSFIRFQLRKAEWNQFKEIGRSGLYIFLLIVNVIVAYNGDNLILGMLIGTASVALYSIAFRIVMISRAMIDNFSNVLFPVIAELKAKKENDKLRWIHYKGVKLGFACSILVAILFSIFGEEIISVWVRKENFVGSNVVYVLSFWLILICTSFPTSNILLILGKEKWFGLLATFTTLTNLILSFVLVKKLGIVGTALATVVAAFISYFFVILWEIKILNDSFLRYLQNSIVPILGPALFLSILSIMSKKFVINMMSGQSRLEAASILVFFLGLLSLLYFLIIYLLGTDKEEKNLFHSKLFALKAKLSAK